MKLKIIQNKKYFYSFSGSLFLISILCLIAWGLRLGIDFSGGSLMELNFSGPRPESQRLQNELADFKLEDLRIQPAGEQDVIMRFKTIEENTHQEILAKIKNKFEQPEQKITEKRFESVGPIIGQELQQKAWIAIFLATLMIILYIAYAFRKVSKPVASWKYGVAAIIALTHDIVIVVGLFSILGHFRGIEVDSLFITALLTILGFSVHDTIVVFDRTRENLARHYSADFEAVVNDSVNQTIVRSINTSVTTLLTLTALFLFGGETIKNFTLALIAGITVGTYSSIFVASPIIVSWHNFSRRARAAR
jgi:preprotein translocase subunit SecF